MKMFVAAFLMIVMLIFCASSHAEKPKKGFLHGPYLTLEMGAIQMDYDTDQVSGEKIGRDFEPAFGFLFGWNLNDNFSPEIQGKYATNFKSGRRLHVASANVYAKYTFIIDPLVDFKTLRILPFLKAGMAFRVAVLPGNRNATKNTITQMGWGPSPGGELKDGNFSRVAQIGKLEALIEKSVPAKPGDGLFDIMRERFSRFESPVLAAVEARSRERLKYLENTLLRRKESEITDLNTVLDDLEKGILKEFENEGHEELQLSLWPEEERSQLRRDIEALRTRLARIPDERKNETEMIESRYSNPVDRTFPVAVVFLVPQSMLSGK